MELVSNRQISLPGQLPSEIYLDVTRDWMAVFLT
jgi:hypothetical protein